MADWFDILLENIGIQPSAIPALLRWQVLQGELTEGGNE
jgi:predicted ATP-dependent Lon-type protease